MGVGGIFFGCLGLCIVIALIIELKERHLK